jgi:hypothetical protein
VAVPRQRSRRTTPNDIGLPPSILLDTPTDTAAAKRALVRTYNTPAYADPWDCVQDFERVQRKAAENPNKGSAALASVVDLPRGRIRPWLDGARPDCYRGLQTALERGWILDEWNQRGRALNCLAAWTLTSGSIDTDWWVPQWVADTEVEREALERYAEAGGIRLVRTREDDDRPDEYRPDADASVLGRVLSTWTGLQGDKDRTVRFPRYVRFAPDEVARDFCRVYVAQRGVEREHGRLFTQIAATRSDAFRVNLLHQLRRVVDDPDSVRGESWPLRIYEPAKSQLAGYPGFD